MQQDRERLIGKDKERRRDNDQTNIASIRQLEAGVQDQRVNSKQHEKHGKQRQQFASECYECITSRAAQPSPSAAPGKFAPDGIAGGNRYDDVENGRHDGAQQERGVVDRRIRQDILLDDKRPAPDRLQSDLAHRRETRRGRGNCVAQRL